MEEEKLQSTIRLTERGREQRIEKFKVDSIFCESAPNIRIHSHRNRKAFLGITRFSSDTMETAQRKICVSRTASERRPSTNRRWNAPNLRECVSVGIAFRVCVCERGAFWHFASANRISHTAENREKTRDRLCAEQEFHYPMRNSFFQFLFHFSCLPNGQTVHEPTAQHLELFFLCYSSTSSPSSAGALSCERHPRLMLDRQKRKILHNFWQTCCCWLRALHRSACGSRISEAETENVMQYMFRHDRAEPRAQQSNALAQN